MSIVVASRPKMLHLCTMAPGQQNYEADLRTRLKRCGYTLLANERDPLSRKLQAARTCDLCLLILGPEFGLRDTDSLFSHAELEALAALVDGKSKRVYVIAQSEIANLEVFPEYVSVEQRDFIRRMLDFNQGLFGNVWHVSDGLEGLLQLILNSFASWHPIEQYAEVQPHVQHEAIMISSTGKMSEERLIFSQFLKGQGISTIDYKEASAEAVRPREWVMESARQCRAVFLIMGADYGSDTPYEGLGATELEFECAVDQHVPVYVFLRDDAPDPTKGLADMNLDQAYFVQRVRRYISEEQIFTFNRLSSDEQKDPICRIELEKLVARALGLLVDLHPAPQSSQEDEDLSVLWYRRRIQRWMGTLPHLVRKQGVPLERVYVTLQTLPRQPLIQEKAKEQDEGRVFDRERSQRQEEERKKIQTLSVEDALKQFPRLVLQGNPGCGKSVALRWYALTASEDVIPIFIPLAKYAREVEKGLVQTLKAFIAREERHFLLRPSQNSSLWVEQLYQGRGLLLLDALDEVPLQFRDQVQTSILELAQDLFLIAPTSRIVLTTRSAGFNPERLESIFTITTVQSLTPAQQRQLIRYWFRISSQGRPEVIGDRTNKIVAALQRQASLNSWARTPLMLTLLTTLAAVTDIDFMHRTITKAEIYRQSIRLMLGQWSTLDDRHRGRRVRQKELLLLSLAWRNLENQRRELITYEDMLQAGQQLPVSEQHECDPQGKWVEPMLEELSSIDGILLSIGADYTFYHPTFQEYLVATHLASLPTEKRRQLLKQHRLNEQWEEITQLLVSELDRSGQPAAADTVIETLISADEQPVSPHAWSDPLHLALARAARCQGIRVPEMAERLAGQRIAHKWGEILEQITHDLRRNQYMWEQACQALLDMGTAATYAYSYLDGMLRKWEAVSDRVIGGRPRFPVVAVEALGNIRDMEILIGSSDLAEKAKQNLHVFLNSYNPYDDDRASAALRALLHLGVKAAEPVRAQLLTIIDEQKGVVGLKEIGELAAILLLQLSPTLKELAMFTTLGSIWKQEALWATLAFEPEMALSFLKGKIADGISSYGGPTKNQFDRSDDDNIDTRTEALEVARRLGMSAEPLIYEIWYCMIFDIERNQRLAEEIFISLGRRAALFLKDAFLRWGNMTPSEVAFQPVLYKIETAKNEEQFKEYLKEGIKQSREIERIISEKDNSYREQRLMQEALEEEKQKANLHKLLRNQPFFYEVRYVE